MCNFPFPRRTCSSCFFYSVFTNETLGFFFCWGGGVLIVLGRDSLNVYLGYSCPALHSANFKTWKYLHDMHCDVHHVWCLFLYARQEKRAEKAPECPCKDTCLLPCRSHHLPFSSVSHDIDGVTKGTPPSLGIKGQNLGVGGRGGKEFGRSSHFL